MRFVVVVAAFRRLCPFVPLIFGWCAAAANATASNPPPATLLTNLLQFREAAEQYPVVIHPFRIVADVVDADDASGALLLRDASDVEFIRVNFRNRKVEPGATVCLEGTECAAKPESFGLKIVPGMIVDNDGDHPMATESGRTFLHAGKNPLTVSWFNRFGDFGLNVEYEGPDLPRQRIPSSALSRAVFDRATGRTNFFAGLDYRCCEGEWDFLPDFRKCQPARAGVATNFDLDMRTRDTAVGLEFKGFIAIPADGVYTFYLTSDDGSRLCAGDSSLDVRMVKKQPAPSAADGVPTSISERTNRPWVSVEGTVTYASIWNSGGELQLRAGNNDLRVEVFESGGVVPNIAPHSMVRVSGIYEDVVTEVGSRVPGRLLVLNWKAIQPAGLSKASSTNASSVREAVNPQTTGEGLVEPVSSPLSTVAEVKALSTGMAMKQLPVSIQGVITAYSYKYGGAVLQDATKGVFVDLHELREAEPLQRGEFCRIEGVTSPGLFSPVVVAQRIGDLGPGRLPEPQHATWGQLVNGSLDNEYMEIDGVVTAVHERQMVLLMQGGKITLDLSDCRPESLLGYEDSLVRIRGCLFVNFNLATHQLEPGPLTVRGAAIEVIQPAPRDLFATPHKSIGELLFYDPKATPFRLLKVSGQIIYGRSGEYFLTDGTNGMSVNTRETNSFAVGDLVDAVGFLELGGPAAELREAVMRRIGRAPLCLPAKLAADQLLQASNADMRVRVDATLMNQWREGSENVLQLQAGFLAFRARVSGDGQTVNLPPSGSRLELTGAYVPQGDRAGDGSASGFELLLNSMADMHILATPPWWNLKRVLVLAGILAALLLAVLVWNKELQWKVIERGKQLEAEIRNRQEAELKHAAEAERSRIARDLHDELGTGLTEVSLLAGAGLAETRATKKSHDHFHDIAEKARALVSGLDVIVWAIDPKRSSLQSFADYLGRYTTELFSATDLVCRFKIPIECDAITLTEAARHSLFLAVKEALNNVIRHASATEVEMQILWSDDCLQVVIADNGRGFDWNTIERGNGLTNLRERMEALNGECHIESQAGKGTTVKFKVPLPRDPN